VLASPCAECVRDSRVERCGCPFDLSGRVAYEQRIPLGRLSVPEDVADAAMFLASDASRYVTGQELVVGGGLMINGFLGHPKEA
jgi:NAD(P)-dependent dehydrogenase (short-subunit alcohol dehydrogenase family)